MHSPLATALISVRCGCDNVCVATPEHTDQRTTCCRGEHHLYCVNFQEVLCFLDFLRLLFPRLNTLQVFLESSEDNCIKDKALLQKQFEFTNVQFLIRINKYVCFWFTRLQTYNSFKQFSKGTYLLVFNHFILAKLPVFRTQSSPIKNVFFFINSNKLDLSIM